MRARLQIFESGLNEIKSFSKFHNFRLVFYVIANVCVFEHVLCVVSWFNSAKHFEEKKKEKEEKKEEKEEKDFNLSKIEQITRDDERRDSDDRRELKEEEEKKEEKNSKKKKKKRRIERKKKKKMIKMNKKTKKWFEDWFENWIKVGWSRMKLTSFHFISIS